MFSNEARRLALAEAREKAVTYARAADEIYGRTGEDSPETNAATMWATVAIALKTGPAMEADAAPEFASGGYIQGSEDPNDSWAYRRSTRMESLANEIQVP